MSAAIVKKTIEQINREEISRTFRLTPGRLNQTLEFLGIPYRSESHGEGSKRVYVLINQKGEKLEFSEMSQLIFETPLKDAIKALSVEKLTERDDFFADIQGTKPAAKGKGNKTKPAAKGNAKTSPTLAEIIKGGGKRTPGRPKKTA